MKVALTGGVLALTGLLFFGATQNLPMGEDPALLADVEAAKAQLETLRAERDAMDGTVAQMKEKLERAESSSMTFLAKNAELAAANADLALTVSTLENATGTAKEGEEALKTMLQTAHAKVETLGIQLADLSDEKVALIGKNAELSNEITLLASANADLTGENSILLAAKAVAAGRIAELEAVSSNVAPADAGALADLQGRFDQQVASLSQAESQVTDLTQSLSAQKQNTAEMERQLSDYETELDRLVARVGVLAESLSERDTAIADLKSNPAIGVEVMLANCQEQTDAVLSGSPIRFDRGSTNIAAGSIASLEEIANIAATCVTENLSLEIEGHTDGVGGDASNLLLSTSRANAVYAFLEEKSVPADAMRSVGFGESEPIADNDTSEGQAQNRRIIFDWEIR